MTCWRTQYHGMNIITVQECGVVGAIEKEKELMLGHEGGQALEDLMREAPYAFQFPRKQKTCIDGDPLGLHAWKNTKALSI